MEMGKILSLLLLFIELSYGFKQLISEPTHLLPRSSSCIDLIFTNQPNMIINSGVFLSIHQTARERSPA